MNRLKTALVVAMLCLFAGLHLRPEPARAEGPAKAEAYARTEGPGKAEEPARAEEPGPATDYRQLVEEILAAPPEARKSKMVELYQSLQKNLSKGNFKKAIPIGEALLSISEVLNKDFPSDHGLAVANAGRAYGGSGDKETAKKYFAKAVQLMSGGDQANLPYLMQILMDYAKLQDSTGEVAAARGTFQKVIALLDSTKLGDRFKVEYYTKLIPLYQVHYQDKFTAILLHEKLLSVYRNRVGENNKHYLLTEFELSKLYVGTGELHKAKKILDDLLERIPRIGGEKSPDLIGVYQNYAQVYELSGDYAAAEKCLGVAMDLVKVNDKAPSKKMRLLKHDLASVYLRKGDALLAKKLWEEVAAEIVADQGSESAYLIMPYKGLYLTYMFLDKKEDAERISKRVYDLETPNAASNPMGHVKTMADYATALYRNGKKPEGLRLMKGAYDKVVALKGKNSIELTGLSYQWGQLLANEGSYREAYDVMTQTMATRYENMIGELYGFGERDSLRYLERQRYMIDSLLINVTDHLADAPANVRGIFDLWLKYKGIVLDVEKFKQLVVNSPEEQETGKIRGLFVDRMHRVNSGSLAQSLPDGQLYLDFARVKDFDPLTETVRGERYLAFAFAGGARPILRLVDLGKTGDIDALVRRYSKELSATSVSGRAPNEKLLRDLGAQLYARVLAPLEASFPGNRELIVSPDGPLNLIPFEVMLTPGGEFLIDKYRIRTLSSARDLINRPQPQLRKNAVVVFADPDYDGIVASAAPGAPPPGLVSTGLHSFARLPDTAREADSIAGSVAQRTTLPYRLFQGVDASEQNLFSVTAPNILHIATHGFYLKKLLPAGAGAGTVGTLPLDELSGPDNPLLRSGIVLAGVNHSIAGHSDAGVVTAAKMLSLDLKNTDLVVLSACNTGVGDLEAGDGVVGLKRSMLLAGARTVITSMWSIASKETADLVGDFYLTYLGGTAKGEALREAKLKLKRDHPNPFYWGSLVLDGAWD